MYCMITPTLFVSQFPSLCNPKMLIFKVSSEGFSISISSNEKIFLTRGEGIQKILGNNEEKFIKMDASNLLVGSKEKVKNHWLARSQPKTCKQLSFFIFFVIFVFIALANLVCRSTIIVKPIILCSQSTQYIWVTFIIS